MASKKGELRKKDADNVIFYQEFKKSIGESLPLDLDIEKDKDIDIDKGKDTKTSKKTAPKKSSTPTHAVGHRARLRERFIKSGLDGVSEYELLELILFGANPRGDVKPLAKELIKKFGDIYSVVTASAIELEKVKGIGQAAIACIKSAQAVAQLMLKQKAKADVVISSLDAVVEYCRASMSHLRNEEFRALFLDSKNKLMEDEFINSGTTNKVSVYPREIAKRAIEIGATAVILVHNHPSGDPTPSNADIEVTYKIQHALNNLEINLYDHIVIGQNDFISFKQRSLL